MFGRPNLYSLDIETDTTVNGLDPNVAAITEVSLSTFFGDTVLTGPEDKILADLDDALRNLPAGMILTWNGAFFDLPFLDTRARMRPGRERFGMKLTPAAGLEPKYSLLPGWTCAQSCVWIRGTDSAKDRIPHQHLDISFAYKRVAADLGVSWSLKPVCKALGIDMIEVDRAKMHELTESERVAYVASDTRGTLELGCRLLGV